MTDEVMARAIVLAGLEEENETLCLCVEEAINYVLLFCHIDMLTEELYAITAHIAVSMYSQAKNGNVASIKEGDRQIDYFMSTECDEMYKNRLKPFINNRGKIPSEV